MKHSFSVLEDVELSRGFFLKNDIYKAISVLKEDEPSVKHIKKELENNFGNEYYLNSFSTTVCNYLAGIFKCPYLPYLSLEYSIIEEAKPTIKIRDKFSNIRCVRQMESTKGISHEQVVAIFPENFKNVKANESHPVFYFVNKFSKRHLKYTRPFLEKSKCRNIFMPILNLSEDRLEGIIANWVNLHEASHRLGPMPIPKYLFEKSNLYTAALEELRADVFSINSLFGDAKSKECDEYLTAIYILSERLCSYPLLRDRYNFDSISSVFLWKFLSENEFLNDFSVKSGIGEIKAFIESLEEISLLDSSSKIRKLKLKTLVLEFLDNYDQQFEKYSKFWSIK